MIKTMKSSKMPMIPNRLSERIHIAVSDVTSFRLGFFTCNGVEVHTKSRREPFIIGTFMKSLRECVKPRLRLRGQISSRFKVKLVKAKGVKPCQNKNAFCDCSIVAHMTDDEMICPHIVVNLLFCMVM